MNGKTGEINMIDRGPGRTDTALVRHYHDKLHVSLYTDFNPENNSFHDTPRFFAPIGVVADVQYHPTTVDVYLEGWDDPVTLNRSLPKGIGIFLNDDRGWDFLFTDLHYLGDYLQKGDFIGITQDRSGILLAASRH
jgi:hypothetical protein